MERERDRERRLGSRRESSGGADLPYGGGGGGGEERKKRTTSVGDDGDEDMDTRERKIARRESLTKKVNSTDPLALSASRTRN